MKNLITVLFCLFAFFVGQADDHFKGERKSLQFKETLEELKATNADDIRELITIAGYNKTIRDRDETFYVTNNSNFHLSKLVLQFSYYTEKGEMLTEEEYEVVCDIPSKATRQLSVKSFDIHHNHYYYKSRRPTRDAIPYKVVYTLKRIDVTLAIDE